MAEWCQLPKELLDLVTKHLHSEIDILRFRSVCSSWRSSVSAKPFCYFSRFPILPNDGISETSWGFYLSKRSIYLVGFRPPHPHPHPHPEIPFSDGWLVKIERESPHRVHLLNPFSRSELKPLPFNFPKYFDFWDYPVSELGHEYTLQYINYRPLANSIVEAGNLYMEKVALSFSVPGIDGFVLLTIHVSGKLVMLKYGDKKWSIIDDLPSPYDDVIFYDGRFYAVDNTGRTVVVDVSSPPSVNLVAQSVFGGDKKFLVESFGELLLVDMYLSIEPEDDLRCNEGYEFHDEFDCYMRERTVRFKVFQLDRYGQIWVEVRDLGDRMLFLGENCTFSACASDFNLCKGNCILFTDHLFNTSREGDGAMKNRGVGVFDLEGGSIGPLLNYPGYSKLFWPPPDWVFPSSSSIETQIDRLDI